jgi:Domain of unknown function (DUF397)
MINHAGVSSFTSPKIETRACDHRDEGTGHSSLRQPARLKTFQPPRAETAARKAALGAVRDSKNQAGPVLRVDLTALLTEIKSDRLTDSPGTHS